MIDCGELDWKVVAINAEDPMAKKMEDSKDVADAVVSGCFICINYMSHPY